MYIEGVDIFIGYDDRAGVWVEETISSLELFQSTIAVSPLFGFT